MDTRRHSPTQRGFTILEALIALLVMSFGILALAGMQLMLSHSADIAKQRSEATRLAQERMELIRSYDGVSTGTMPWNNLPGAAQTVTTNAAFTVTPTMGGSSGDPLRPVSVAVSWTDRTGAAQSVVLTSVVAKTEPEDIGFLTNPLPLNQPLRRVKDRNINIPIPALDLGGGQSATQFSPTMAIVYSNTSGNVVQWCTLPSITNATAADVSAAIAGSRCTSVTGYIVAGYINRSPNQGSSGITNAEFSSAFGINLSSVNRNTDGSYPITCQFSDARNQNDSTAIIGDYKYYLCVVPLNAPFTWAGTIRVSSTAANILVCRYQYGEPGLDNNERNIQPYVAVNKSIDEQNYLITRADTCPTQMSVTELRAVDGSTTPTSVQVSTGVIHQNCRTSASPSSTTCPTSASP